MKLYRYYESVGRMGDIEGLLFLTDEEVTKYKEYTHCLWWYEVLGKHSEDNFHFSDTTLSVIELPEEAIKALYDAVGSVVSGPFDLGYFEEQIEEYIESNKDDEEDD